MSESAFVEPRQLVLEAVKRKLEGSQVRRYCDENEPMLQAR